MQDRKVILYIAASLDGKIAKPDGDTQWLHSLPNPQDSDYGYAEFCASVDTILMGRHTYQVIRGFDVPEPVPTGKTSYVFSSTLDSKHDPDPRFHIVRDNPVEFVRELKGQSGKQDIWLMGGGELNATLLNAGMIDEIMLFVMPVVLGNGISLFGSSQMLLKKMKLTSTKVYEGGVVLMRYSS